jgi:hypothetical protein
LLYSIDRAAYAIAKAAGAPLGEVWSRQSLSDNKDIYDAFLVAKRRLKEEPAAPAVMNEADAAQKFLIWSPN